MALKAGPYAGFGFDIMKKCLNVGHQRIDVAGQCVLAHREIRLDVVHLALLLAKSSRCVAQHDWHCVKYRTGLTARHDKEQRASYDEAVRKEARGP
ncbi:hypothetical protein D9M72_556920 [compost metagenome]